MDKQFSDTIDKIDSFAEKSGTWLNTKISKISMILIFIISLGFFGLLIFSSKFLKRLCGIKE